MGSLMAQHLVSVGVQVVAFDVDETKRKQFEFPAESPSDVAKNVEWIVCMLPHPDVLRDVLLGKNGIHETAKRGTIVIDMSTSGPDIDVFCAHALEPSGIELIDAPVGKGTWAAGQGALTILAGGESGQIKRATWLLSLLGTKIIHCGPLGSGQVVKLGNNIATCANLAAAFEAYQFATSNGANAEALLEVMRDTAADSWQLNNTVPRALANDFSLGFKSSLALKDLTLTLSRAETEGLYLPCTKGASTWYQRSVDAGDGELDLGVIFKQTAQVTEY
jgi:3-hydroxyisobutyrate dehydrogenase-like beta-hydroxyacid dehydrogenase